MRSSFAPRGGHILVRTPSFRDQAGRRRLLAVCAVLALAIASGVIGSLTTSRAGPAAPSATGPFSYFPSE